MAVSDVRPAPVSILIRYPLATYFGLTLGIIWATAPLAIVAPAVHGILNAFNPALVAIALTAALEGQVAVRTLLARLVAWRVPARWYLVAFGVPIGMALLALVFGALLGLPISNPIDRVPPTLAALLVFIWLIAPGEELGWRGFALPRLLIGASPLVASLVLGVVGIAFHLSAYVLPILVPDHPAPGMPFVAFGVQYLSLSLLATWIFLGSRGSVFLTVIFHATLDVVGNLAILALGADTERGTWIWTACVVAVALVVLRFGVTTRKGFEP